MRGTRAEHGACFVLTNSVCLTKWWYLHYDNNVCHLAPRPTDTPIIEWDNQQRSYGQLLYDVWCGTERAWSKHYQYSDQLLRSSHLWWVVTRGGLWSSQSFQCMSRVCSLCNDVERDTTNLARHWKVEPSSSCDQFAISQFMVTLPSRHSWVLLT